MRLRALLLAGLLAAAALARANGYPSTVAAALDKAGIPQAAVAFVVMPAAGGEALLSVNAGQPMNPASTMKLVTTYAALKSLGPAYTWKTSIWADGEIRDGRLDGDLIIRGGGDPYLTIERLWLLQHALRLKGVREIAGDLVLDLSLYELPPLDAGEFDGEPLAAYNAVPSPLVVNFNAQNLLLTVDGDTVRVRPEWPLGNLRFVSNLRLSDEPCNGWRSEVDARIPDPGVPELVLEGSYPRACGEKTLPLNLFEPPFNFVVSFRTLWEESGGKWRGDVAPGMAPVDRPPLLEFESPPLGEMIRPLNKYSSNIMTRMLFLTLGQHASGAPATLGKSVPALHGALREEGLDFPELVLENGSGLSRDERISASSMVRLLQAAARSPYFSEFEAALPIAAVDGTMRKRANGAAGHAHLKTGSLKDVRAVAGYVLDRGGQRWALAFFVNHANARDGAEALDALVEWVRSQGADAEPRP